MPKFIFSSRKPSGSLRTLDVRADDTDPRDYLFQPTLRLLPGSVDHRGLAPVLDQELEGACVGFALATVINVSLWLRSGSRGRRRKQKMPDAVSTRMLYEMGRRYDEWSGEDYDGTSLRGAMKGWHRHGVTTEKLWPYKPPKGKREVVDRNFSFKRARDALRRPIGAYFRILDTDVSHLQAAVMEGDAVLASAWVHDGWQDDNLVGKGLKQIRLAIGRIGLHAFAIVGYTPEGFIIQNSWGKSWGQGGFALLGYDDWFENRQDAWVARPGSETRDSKGNARIFVVGFAGGTDSSRAGTSASGLDINPQVVPCLINTGDKGALSTGGSLVTQPNELHGMARQVLTAPVLRDGYRHVILYAHGGLNGETKSAQTADRLWALCKENHLASYFFIWESGITESIFGWLRSEDDATGPARFSWKDAWSKIKKGAAEVVRSAQEKLGAGLAPVVREVFWDEMKGRAEGACTANGGAALFASELFKVFKRTPGDQYKIHLVGHSAGSIYLGCLYEKVLHQSLAAQSNVKLASIQFLAPAITIQRTKEAFFNRRQCVLPKKSFRVHMLDPKDEERDNIQIYPSSLLTYVADHLEHGRTRVPLLGLERDFHAATSFATPMPATRSVKHGQFDDAGHEIERVVEDIVKCRV